MYEVTDNQSGLIFKRTNSPRVARVWVRLYNRLGYSNIYGTRLTFTYTLRGV